MAPLPLELFQSNHRPAAIVRMVARIPKTIQARQTFGSTSKIFSPPARRLPGRGYRGTEAGVQLRHEEPASEDSHLPSVRKVEESVVNASQKAGGASSLKTLASIVFESLRKKLDTSNVEVCFQLRELTCRVSPFIFSSTRFAARTSNRADPGCESSVNVRRNVASIVATRCERASGAAGKMIHSARLSPGRKLIFGSCTHFQASQPKAMAAAATRNNVLRNVFTGKTSPAVAA